MPERIDSHNSFPSPWRWMCPKCSRFESTRVILLSPGDDGLELECETCNHRFLPVESEIEQTPAEAEAARERLETLMNTEFCPSCGGSGENRLRKRVMAIPYSYVPDHCPNCSGTGRIRKP